MTATSAVPDGDTKGQIRNLVDGKVKDMERRVQEGTIPLDYTLCAIADALQEISEGRIVLGGLLELVPPLLNLTAVKESNVGEQIKLGQVIGDYEITYVDPDFDKQYAHLIERDVPARKLPVWRLLKSSRDLTIIKLLGELPKAEMAIAHAVQVIKRGPKGPGLFNGSANIGYKNGWAFVWYVNGRELGWSADSVSRPGVWGRGFGVCGG